MAEFDLSKSLVLIRRDQNAPADDYDAAITDAAGWTDLSEAFEGFVSINPTRETRRLEPHGSRRRGKVLAGAGAGTVTMRAKRTDSAAGDEAAAMLDAIEASADARFSLCVQPDRDALTAGNVVTPAASAGNPQYLTHCVLSNLDQWGTGGTDQAFMRSTSELDSDYGVYRA